MIEKVEIVNFKRFENVTVQLQPFTVLISPGLIPRRLRRIRIECSA